jgi:hypothetical protein
MLTYVDQIASKVGTGCKEAGEKNYVGNISGNLQHL